MHFYHGILVQISGIKKGETLTDDLRKDLEHEAKTEVDNALESYLYNVYDYYNIVNGSHWDQNHPDREVVFGIDPEFNDILNYFKDLPLKTALKNLKRYRYTQLGWRTEEQIETCGDFRMVILNNSKNGQPIDDDKPKYWSGIDLGYPIITEDFLKTMWEKDRIDGWNVKQALKIVDGEYDSDSHFYSVPDGESKITSYTQKELDHYPERFAIVFVDMHI